MNIRLALTFIAFATAGAANAEETPVSQALPGVWSLGETKNCDTGPAWVFLADGYYAEVKLPDQGPFATGLWKDEGSALAYTHSHMPFPDMMTPNEMKRLTVDERTADKLVTRNYQGVPRVFHRCPSSALKAPSGQAKH